MSLNPTDEMLATARELFQTNQYLKAEALLNQLILKSSKSAEIFQMLGTIYYDQGKFNKAIRSFKRALEIDPTYTDASVGLSIILNDLGRYDEGREVFQEAKTLLAEKSVKEDPYANEKLASKHDELGELYMQFSRPKEAIDQYLKALQLSSRRPELTLKLVECYCRVQEFDRAFQELKSLVGDYPGFLTARIRLGKLYYDSGDTTSAIEQWENVIQRDPEHAEAQRLLRQVEAASSAGRPLSPEALL